jgi:hypothetical protein
MWRLREQIRLADFQSAQSKIAADLVFWKHGKGYEYGDELWSWGNVVMWSFEYNRKTF